MKQCEFPKCGRGKSRCMCEGDPVTTPTPDAVAQARAALMLSVAALRDIADSDAVHHSGWGAMIHRHADAIAGTCYSRIVAAERAECAAKVRSAPRHNGLEADSEGAFVYRDDALAALEAK